MWGIMWTGEMPMFSSSVEKNRWMDAGAAEAAAYYALHPEEENAAMDAHYETDLDRTIKRIAYEEALEDIEEMNIWANNAYGVALRAALKK